MVNPKVLVIASTTVVAAGAAFVGVKFIKNRKKNTDVETEVIEDVATEEAIDDNENEE